MLGAGWGCPAASCNAVKYSNPQTYLQRVFFQGFVGSFCVLFVFFFSGDCWLLRKAKLTCKSRELLFPCTHIFCMIFRHFKPFFFFANESHISGVIPNKQEKNYYVCVESAPPQMRNQKKLKKDPPQDFFWKDTKWTQKCVLPQKWVCFF